MWFIAHEGKVWKVSFECCRPYKLTRRLSLERSGQFVWVPRTPTSSGRLIVQKSVPAVRIHLRSANESWSLGIVRSADRNSEAVARENGSATATPHISKE